MEKIKLGLRYVVILFIMYLAWIVIQPAYAQGLKDLGDIGIGAIYTSVFGALTFVLKSNFEQGIDK